MYPGWFPGFDTVGKLLDVNTGELGEGYMYTGLLHYFYSSLWVCKYFKIKSYFLK